MNPRSTPGDLGARLGIMTNPKKTLRERWYARGYPLYANCEKFLDEVQDEIDAKDERMRTLSHCLDNMSELYLESQRQLREARSGGQVVSTSPAYGEGAWKELNEAHTKLQERHRELLSGLWNLLYKENF